MLHRGLWLLAEAALVIAIGYVLYRADREA